MGKLKIVLEQYSDFILIKVSSIRNFLMSWTLVQEAGRAVVIVLLEFWTGSPVKLKEYTEF